jgi:hypothetical protein
MVFYEINLTINTEIEDEYLAWIPEHMQEMLQFAGFNKASFSEAVTMDPHVTNTDIRNFTILYEVESLKHLQDYFQHHAARMRQEGIDKFGDNFSASRRVLNLLRSEKK